MSLLLLILACETKKGAEARLVASPDELSSFGYERVTLDLRESGVEPAEVVSVRVAGILAYDLEPADGELTVTVQGAPESGPAEVTLETAEGETTFADVLSFAEPASPAFSRLFVVGASLGMGVQSAGASPHGQLASPAAALARHLGAPLPLPILQEGLFAQIGAEDVGDPPLCALPDASAFATAAISDTLGALRDPETDEFGYANGRVDPELSPANVSVPGSGVCDVALGPTDFDEVFISHLVYDVDGDLADPIETSQIQLALDAEPTIFLSFDLLGNDLIDMVLDGDLDTSLATPADDVRTCLAEVLAVAETGAEVYIANTPDVNVLPAAAQRASALLESGTLDEAELAARQSAVREVVVQTNAILDELAAAYPNVHVLDAFTVADGLLADGLDVGAEHLEIRPLGGLVSLDGLHFSDVGYALMAREMAKEIAEVEGLSIPELDLAEALETDPWSPEALRAMGLDPDACE